MAANAWRDLENLAKGESTPPPKGPSSAPPQRRAGDTPVQNRPASARPRHTSSGPTRSQAEDARAGKRPRREEPERECSFELENVGPREIEAFKRNPLLTASDICRSADQLIAEMKADSDRAHQERDAALKRLNELEPQVRALGEKDRQLGEARKAVEAAERGKRMVEEERTQAVRKNRELQSQMKNLSDQLARADEEKRQAVAVESKRVAGLARAAVVEQFNNVVSQMKIFNAARGAEFNEKIISIDHVVENGEIVLPQLLDGEGNVTQARKVVFGRPGQ